MPISPPSERRTFESLVKVVEALRDPINGCPWDREQTLQSLTKYAIEETFELVEAVENNSREDILEELGDVLLQVVLNSEVARQEGLFDIYDVIEKLNTKMISRHSHVFGDKSAGTAEEALSNWNNEKQSELKNKKRKTFDVPVALPALQRAQKIGDKTKKLRFDWPDILATREKLNEELAELDEAIHNSQYDRSIDNLEKLKSEIGDVLFTVAQVARHANIDSEQALRECNTRFELRFETLLQLIKERGENYDDKSLQELESLWQEAKRRLADTN